MTTRRVVSGALVALALALLLGRWTSGLYTDYLWFDSLGASAVWRAKVATSFAIGGASFLGAALFAFVNLYAVRRSVVSLVLPRRISNIEIGEEVPSRYLLLMTWVLSALVGIALMIPTDEWTEALLARIGRPFGETDPYFAADLGFFVYWLPFERTLHFWAVLLLAIVAALVVALYALTPSLRWDSGRLYVSAYVRRHFIMLGAALMLVLAWSYRLGMYELLAQGGGQSGVFSVIDHRVLVPAMLLLAVVTMCAALVVGWAGWTGQIRLAFLAVSTVLVLSVVARSIAPLLARRTVDPAAALVQERPYLATRLGYTRRAYGVDRMRPDTIGDGLTDLAEVGRAVAVWDGVALAHAAQRLRRVSVVGDGAAWAQVGPSLAAFLVEHTSETADSHDAWAVGRFDPTSADERGMPLRAGAATRYGEEVLLEEPAVYDSAPGYSIVSDSLHRIIGVEMVSTRSRVAHAWALQNFRLLFGDLPLDRPTIVRVRDVRRRVAAIAPFFVQGSSVAPVIAGDSLYWAIELYSTSDTYPLSQRFTVLGAERGYLLHAGTALVHAASGGVRLVAAAAPDPIAASWAAAFPRLFTSVQALPPALRAVLPPASDGARTQALAFASAGFRGDSLEVRHLATLDGADSAASREPLHAVLPGLGVAELWPLLDEQERVRGVVAAGAGEQHATTWIPLLTDSRRWGGVVDRLRTADSTGHEGGIVHAPLRVVPVGGKPLYLQSSFQWRPGGSPRLMRVALLVGDSLHVGPTLAAAVGTGTTSVASSTTPQAFRARTDSLYRAMRDALARGDWTSFGRAFDALGQSLHGARP